MLQKLSDIAKNRFTATATAGLATVALLTPGVFNQQAHADGVNGQDTKPIVLASATLPNAEEVLKEPKSLEYVDAYMRSDGRIVLHYGEGIKDADLAGEILEEDSDVKLPVEVYAGAAKGEVHLYMNYEQFGPFDQSDLNKGNITAFAVDYLERKRNDDVALNGLEVTVR